MYVIIFNRDAIDPADWRVVGTFSTQESAGAYARFDYRTSKRAWIVLPVGSPS